MLSLTPVLKLALTKAAVIVNGKQVAAHMTLADGRVRIDLFQAF